MGGSAPRSEPVLIDAGKPSGFDFSKAFFEQVAPALVNAPYPRFGGSIDPGLSPTMAGLLRGGQTLASSPFSEPFNQAGHTLGGLMNVNYENPMASVDPNRYGFDYSPQDFRSEAQSAAPGMPRSMRAAAHAMGGPMGGAQFSSRPSSPLINEGLPDRGNEPPHSGGGGGGGGGGDTQPEVPPNFPGGGILGRERPIDLGFAGFPTYQPIRAGEGFVDYNPGSNNIRIGPGLRAGSHGSNPMPPGPFPSPPGGGGPPASPPPGGGPPVGGGPVNFDPNGIVPGNQLTWFGRHHGVNKGKTMDEIYRDMYERGWDYGPSFQKPEHWGERGSRPTTWAEVMQMPENRRAPGSPGAAAAPQPGGGARASNGAGAALGGKLP